MTSHAAVRRRVVSLALAGWIVLLAVEASAQDRFLGKQDILLFSFGLRVEPERQVVPKDIATIVSTFLQAPNTPPGDVPPFAPGAVLRATLRGPGAGSGIELTAAPNTPFDIPPLGVPGVHTVEHIRLESGGEVLMRGVPESVTIEVIEKLLVTQVTSRALSAQEIREKGIVFDKSNFQAYDFTAAFAVQDVPVRVSFPVVLPTLQGASDVSVSQVGITGVALPKLPELKTIIPDTLRLQTQIPNLQVVGFTLSVPQIAGKTLAVPPIPGVVVIPGDIGFLDQFFSVLLMVGNVAPIGSNLSVRELTGSILLPAGNDTVAGSGDDPLRMARTVTGDAPPVQRVLQPGADGQLGTADDVDDLSPGASASAEYLVEGRREGTHVIEFAIGGTLHGLPGGPVPITGRAAGSVLVRNPTFTLTFTHPETVAAGEPYTLDVTVTNTSESPANFVSVNLFPQHVTGATVVGEPSREVESIPAGDSATVSFDLIARVTGKVTAATLDSDENVQGRFGVKASVGELGVPVSPDSLVLPAQAKALPADLRRAALGLLGKAWSVATAPAAALPQDVSRFSKQIVYDRAVQVAEAGLRITLQEPVPDSVAQLMMDFAGSDVGRLAARYPDAEDRAFAERDVNGFDELRRRSIRGDVWASAVAAILIPELQREGVAGFHQGFAEQVAYRPPHLSVLVGASGGPVPFTVSLVDSEGRRVGRIDASGKAQKQIPYSDFLSFTSGGQTVAQMIVLTAPLQGEYRLQFDPTPGTPAGVPFDVSIVVPDVSGQPRQVVYTGLTGGATPTSPFSASDPYRVLLDLPAPGSEPSGAATPSDARIVPPVPRVISAIQQAQADVISCSGTAAVDELGLAFDVNVGYQVGRIVAVLFSEEVTAASVQDRLAATGITNYRLDDNAVVGVALQPGRRIAFLALRDPVGPFIPRNITISGAAGIDGGVMSAQTVPIQATVTDDGAVVTGQVLNADGSPVPFASLRLLINPCQPSRAGLIGISSKTADAAGRFSWDFVVQGEVASIAAIDPATDEFRTVEFTSQRNGQRLNINVVLLGRGTVKGRALSEAGTPMARASIRLTSLTDQSQYAAQTNADGAFTIPRVPVGSVFIEAVKVERNGQGQLVTNARGAVSELIPAAGAVTMRDITLFDFITPDVTVKYGALTGHVLRGDGSSPVADAPVIAYYVDESQPGVKCPGGVAECPVGLERTDAAGAFSMTNISAGQYRLVTFDQVTFQQGGARVGVPADGTADVNILLTLGLGTVEGIVLDAVGAPVSNARVGGGLSLTTTGADGRFRLTDVPVGNREIVAVSDALGTKGKAVIDLVQAGQVVTVTVVLEGLATISGTVFRVDGVTPVPNNKVFVFHPSEQGIQVVASGTTDAAGRYSFGGLPLRTDYTVSSFAPNFSDGNIRRVALKFPAQVVRADIVFRGGAGGRVSGRVFAADGVTPLRASVGVSAERPVIAGGLVGVGFQHVANFAVTETSLSTGAFEFTGLWAGTFTVTAVGQFSPDPIAVEGTIPAPGAAVSVNLRLQPTSRIGGTVFLPDGVTPAGPDIVVRYRSNAVRVVCAGAEQVTVGAVTIPPGLCGDVPQGIEEETVVTDMEGRYVVPLVNAGRFTVTAEDPRTGKSAQVNGDVKPGQTGEFSIRLLGLSAVTVRVRGSDSITPIPGASVQVSHLEFPRKSITALADAQGTLTLSGGDAFSEGELIVMATDVRNGFAGRASAKLTSDGATVVVDVFLYNQSGTVFGTVFKADGLTPVANAEVVISNDRGALAFAVTDEYGTYREELIPLGDVLVEVFEAATGRRGFATGRIDLDRQEVPIDIVEARRGLVTGTLLDAATLAPIKNAEVLLTQSSIGNRPLPPLQTTSEVDGTFSFPGVSEGDFTIRAYKSAFLPEDPTASGTARAVLAGEGEHADVPVLMKVQRKEYGRVEGTVIAADGSPAANVAIAVCGGLCLGAVTAADGSFAVDRVPVGRFYVRAHSQVNANEIVQYGQLVFDGDTARMTLTLVAVAQVSGIVVFADGRVAANAAVTLFGQPAAGCTTGPCSAFADAQGRFTFINVPARTFTVNASDVGTGLRGVASGTLDPGGSADVRVVLEPTASFSGRVLLSNGSPAAGITVDLLLHGTGQKHFFTVSDAFGRFSLPAIPIGSYTASFEDPLGAGVAFRTLNATAAVALGDVVLDEAPPTVASVAPAASAVAVPRTSVVEIVFSEPVDADTVNQAHIALTGPGGSVTSTLHLSNGDTKVVLTPLAPLAAQTRFSVTIQGVRDRVGKAMAAFASSFTTVDVAPPSVVSLSPDVAASGVPVASAIRVIFSEPIDVTRFRGPPIVVQRGGAAIAGRIDFILGNTGIVFTPLAQLDGDSAYHVATEAAVDLAGNAQAQGLSYTFSTTDRTPPIVHALVPDGDGTVIENAVARVVADVGTTHDVSVVDFFVNDQPAFAARVAPFALSFQAAAALGAPGDRIKISALATDTSGNRSVTPQVVFMPIVGDRPPAVTVVAPADGTEAGNGGRVEVVVRASDDLGVAQVGYRAQTGKPQDASSRASAAMVERIETFAFTVPGDAVPGSTIVVNASAVDTKGQRSDAAPIQIRVLDATAPAITITGTSTGAKVSPGQQTSAVISAQDLGGVASITFSTGGVATSQQTRPVSPAQPSVATAFTFTVPPTARAGDVLTLDATATDAAGNTAAAARVLLPIADLHGPTVRLRTASGSLDLVPGASTTVVVETEDETAVARVALTGQGAFNVGTARQISPPSNEAETLFEIAVPAGAAVGSVLNLAAVATDVFGNEGTPATLSLAVVSVAGVSLPSSLLLDAGDAVPLVVELSTPAPSGGLVVDLTSANPAIAGVTSSLPFNAGETSRTATVTGVTGGLASITAAIGGIPRASTTATVRGAIVSGTVLAPDMTPVAGAEVSVTSGQLTLGTTTDASGAFTVIGVGGGLTTAFTIRAHDPVSGLMASRPGALNAPSGFARVTLVLSAAGSLGGTVLRPDGKTPAGAGVRVDLFVSSDLRQPIGATFTVEDGQYEFPLVSLGNYTIEASDTGGNRGRSSAIVLAESGQHADAPVTFLGRGTVTGRILDGSGVPRPNVPITFTSTSLFGTAPTLATNALDDGTFRIEGAFVGSFTVAAHDPVSDRRGSRSGTLVSDQEVVTLDVTLGAWATLEGTIFRADGTTPAPNAEVTMTLSAGSSSGTFRTTADTEGRYAFRFVPLGSYVLTVEETGTRGLGRGTGTLATQSQVLTHNITLLPQGNLLVVVTDAAGVLVPGARVSVSSRNGQVSDGLSGDTGADGSVLLERILAGQINVTAGANGQSGTTEGSLGAGETKVVGVQLRPSATITGTLYLPDGFTPASAGSVQLCDHGCAPIAVASDGTYRFESLSLRSYTVVAFDAAGRRRARATGIELDTNGEVVTADLTFVGVGSVVGRVLNPDGSGAPNIDVTVRSLNPEFGRFALPRTDAAGFYRADEVVVGNIAVSAGNTAQGLLGEASGPLAAHGDTITLDILLKNNAVTLPATRFDGNFFPWDISRSASPSLGYNGVFGPAFNGAPFGGLLLDLIVDGDANRFTGATFGTTEANGQEIAVTQTGLAGLNVTRKVYIAPYFARYIELISNPTPAPITVDVRVESVTRGHTIVSTSSGDDLLSTAEAEADRWAVLGVGSDVDPFSTSNGSLRSQLAFVFDGAGASVRASGLTFAANQAGSGVLAYTWSSLTIQPGETLALMHVGVQQYSRAAAQASAERLAQLPPELFESLNPFEMAAIRNFALPADGTSQVAPLPRLDGTVTGTVLEADGITPVPSTTTGSGYQLNLVFRSENILFGRAYVSGANLAGRFRFGPDGDLIGFLGPVTVPVAPFTVTALHHWTRVPSPVWTGSFAANAMTADVSLAYTNTGVVKGAVRRHTGSPVAGALISSLFSADGVNYGGTYLPSAADGSFVAGGLLPGAPAVTGRILHPQRLGTVYLTGTVTASIAAGQVLTRDVVLQPTGTLQGTVRTAQGSAAVNAAVDLFVDLASNTNRLRATTDSAGLYRITDVPVGAYNLQTTDPVTGFVSTATATIAQDQTSLVDLTFVASGSVQVTATYTNGQPAANARVDILRPRVSAAFVNAGNTDGTGRLTIANVPGGSFIVRVFRPGAPSSVPAVDVAGTVTTQGEAVPIAATVTPLGSVQVQVNDASGAPVPDAQVTSDHNSATGVFASFQTDANGSLTLVNVPGGRTFRVRATDPVTFMHREVSARIMSEGQVQSLTIVVGVTGTVSGHVTLADGSPAVGVQVQVRTDSPISNTTVTTDAAGNYTATEVPAGAFRALVIDAPRALAGSASGRVESSGETVTRDIPLTAVPLPSTFTDANGYSYRVTSAGTLGQGADTEGYLTAFSISAGAVGLSTTAFGGDLLAAADADRRQLTIANFQGGSRQAPQPVFGTPLQVTRKVYVPESGYFARFLEIFENPTSNPVTIDVVFGGTLTNTRVVATSNADAALQPGDQWFVSDRPALATTPAVGHVFQGGAARAPVTSAQFSTDGASRLRPNLQWRSLVVPANGRAILMHFTTQEPDAAAAQAAAERLAQLPPEALVGLTPTDAEAIVNFSVAPDLSSTVAPFARAAGRVLASDGATPVKALVHVTGNSTPIFKPTVVVPTDEEGRFTAATLVAGTITLNAVDPVTGLTTPQTTAMLQPGETSITRDLAFAASGVLAGTVRMPSGPPAAGVQVTITGGTAAVTVTTGADGRFAIGAIAPGTYAISAASPGRVALSVTGLVVTAGQTTTAELRFGATATLRLTVRRSDGSPFAGARVAVSDAVQTHPTVVADESGIATTPQVAEGPYQVRVLAPDGIGAVAEADGVIAPSDDGRTLDVALQGSAGSISGRLLAADGETALLGTATVDVFDVESNQLLAQTTVLFGQYELPSVAVPGASGFRLVARTALSPDATAEATGFIAPGQAVTRDLTLPVSVVKGTVRMADGSVPPFVFVVTTQEADGGTLVQRAAAVDASGRYSVVGLAAGRFEIVASQSFLGFDLGILETTADGTLDTAASVVVREVVFPAVGTVTGVVRETTGAAAPFAEVALSTQGAGIFKSLRVSADEDGRYRFDNVPVGRLAVQACAALTDAYHCGSTPGALSAGGDQADADVVLPPAGGEISGFVYAADGVTPLDDVIVELRIGAEGPLLPEPESDDTNSSGRFRFRDVPAGPFTLTVRELGVAAAGDNSGGPVTMNFVAGTGPSCPRSLDGSDGFRYDVGCAGELRQGGRNDSPVSRAYAGHAYSLRINGLTTGRGAAARLELGGRQTAFGPMSLAGVTATRRVYVPDSGGFARFVETMTNPGSQPVTLDVQIESALDGPVHTLVDPETTGVTYAVTRATSTTGPGENLRPTLAHVIGGTGAVAASAVHVQALTGTSYYRWTVTIPAGGTVSLMHFAVQRGETDTASAESQAQSLVNLADPGALTGLSAADRATIVNFRIE